MAQNPVETDIGDLLDDCGFYKLGSPPPPEAIESALRELGNLRSLDPPRRHALRSEAVRLLKEAGVSRAAAAVDDALAAATGAGGEESRGNEPEDVVDVVTLSDGTLGLVVIDSGKPRIVPEWKGFRPWPRERLPYLPVPAAADVEAHLKAGAPAPFDELVAHISCAVMLPSPSDPWARLLAGWVLGTYLMERHRYYPLLLLEGLPERGKTRLGKLLAYASRRGYSTATPRGPTLVRDRAFHGVTLMIDVEDLPRVLSRPGELADLILMSFERDGVVRLVTRPDAPPMEQMVTYVAYGPTILITNQAVRSDSPLASRCIRIALPEAGDRIFPPAASPDELSGVRARLVAWAAQMKAEQRTMPEVRMSLRGRARDLAQPLLQTLALAAPEAVAAVHDVLCEVEVERREESGRSWEARVALGLWDARGRVKADRLYIRDLADVVNAGASETEKLTPQQIGVARRRLGLSGNVGGKDKLAFVNWPGDERVQALVDRYAVPEPKESPASPVPPAIGISTEILGRERREIQGSASRHESPHQHSNTGEAGEAGDSCGAIPVVESTGPEQEVFEV
jgi:hypothetical protein